MATDHKFVQMPVDVIVVAENVRSEVSDVDELVDSIRAFGVLEPIVCTPSRDGKRVELLMGHRRLAAAKKAGLETIPAILRPRPNDRDRILMQLAENLARLDMSPVDEGIAFDELIRLDVTKAAIARVIQRSQKYVSDRLRLLDLPDCLRMAVDLGYVRVAAALEFPRVLLGRKDAIARLAKVVRGGDNALRSWIRDEMAALSLENPTARETVGRALVRVIPVSPAAYAAAKKRSKRAGLTLGEWTSRVILDAGT